MSNAYIARFRWKNGYPRFNGDHEASLLGHAVGLYLYSSDGGNGGARWSAIVWVDGEKVASREGRVGGWKAAIDAAKEAARTRVAQMRGDRLPAPSV